METCTVTVKMKDGAEVAYENVTWFQMREDGLYLAQGVGEGEVFLEKAVIDGFTHPRTWGRSTP